MPCPITPTLIRLIRRNPNENHTTQTRIHRTRRNDCYLRYVITSYLSTINAQNGDTTFENIGATQLDIVGDEGEPRIRLTGAMGGAGEAAMRKKMRDDLDAIHDTVKKITGSDRKRSSNTRQTGTGSEV